MATHSQNQPDMHKTTAQSYKARARMTLQQFLGAGEGTGSDGAQDYATTISSNVPPGVTAPVSEKFEFEFDTPAGTTYRFRARSDNFEELEASIAERLKTNTIFERHTIIPNPSHFSISYIDTNGDGVVMISDRDVLEAVEVARNQSRDCVRLFLHWGEGGKALIHRPIFGDDQLPLDFTQPRTLFSSPGAPINPSPKKHLHAYSEVAKRLLSSRNSSYYNFMLRQQILGSIERTGSDSVQDSAPTISSNAPRAATPVAGVFAFAYNTPSGINRRSFAPTNNYSELRTSITRMLEKELIIKKGNSDPNKIVADPHDFKISYSDSHGDLVFLSSDSDVFDAVEYARKESSACVHLNLHGGESWTNISERLGFIPGGLRVPTTTKATHEQVIPDNRTPLPVLPGDPLVHGSWNDELPSTKNEAEDGHQLHIQSDNAVSSTVNAFAPQNQITVTETGSVQGFATTTSTILPVGHNMQTTPQTADLALRHAQNKEVDITSALQRLQWEGEYIIQAGYNEEMLDEGYLVEEIHISLDSDLLVPEARVKSEFSPILSPFLSFIHTPNNTCIIQADSPQMRTWRIGESGGIHDAGTPTQLSSPTERDSDGTEGGNDNGSGSGKGKEPDRASGDNFAGGGDGGNGDGERSDRGDADNGNGRGEGSSSGGGGGGGDGDQGPHSGRKDRDTSGCFIAIPFSSILFDKDEKGNQREVFTISSSVRITVEENRKQEKPAPNSQWPGPWISVDMDSLDGSASGIYLSRRKYLLCKCQTRITGISEQDFSVPYHSPQNTPETEDTAKRREDRTITRGLQATTAPSLNATLTAAHLSSAEHIHKRWGVTTHPVHDEDQAGHKVVGRVWEYAHNDLSLPRVSGYTFLDSMSPFIELGVGKAADAYARLKLEVVMHWSLSSIRKSLSELLVSFFKSYGDREPISVPAFVNFFHTASISIDLRQFDQKEGWVVGAKAKDPMPAGKSSSDTTRKIVKVLTKDGESRCEVILGRALYGRVLAANDKGGTDRRLTHPPTRVTLSNSRG